MSEANGKACSHSIDSGKLVWYTDGSNANEGTGAGEYGYDTWSKLSFTLEQYTTVFQTVVLIRHMQW
jgi:hypothetical protein